MTTFGCRFASDPNGDSWLASFEKISPKYASSHTTTSRLPARAASCTASRMPVDLGRGRHVAGRVVREVQDEQRLRRAAEQRGAQRRHVEVQPVIGGEGLDPAAEPRLEVQRVVVPEHVGDQHAVAGVDEEIADQREPVGQRVRHDRQRDLLAAHRRVLGELLLPPGLAQVGAALGGRVAHRVGGRDVLHVREHRGERHRAVALGRLADGRVEPVGLLLRLGRLRKDALREVQLAAALREQLVQGGALGADLLVQLDGKGVHGGGTLASVDLARVF